MARRRYIFYNKKLKIYTKTYNTFRGAICKVGIIYIYIYILFHNKMCVHSQHMWANPSLRRFKGWSRQAIHAVDLETPVIPDLRPLFEALSRHPLFNSIRCSPLKCCASVDLSMGVIPSNGLQRLHVRHDASLIALAMAVKIHDPLHRSIISA